MDITFLTHENSIGSEITKTLKSRKYSDFKVAVAYIKNSGVTRIYDELVYFSNKGGKTSFIAGIDQNNTSYQALANLKTFTKDNLFIHHDKNFDNFLSISNLPLYIGINKNIRGDIKIEYYGFYYCFNSIGSDIYFIEV